MTELYRRKFLKYLLASPLLASEGFSKTQDALDPDLQYILGLENMLISGPEEALNIFDFEAVARENLPPAHYGYLATGVTDEQSQLANREAFRNLKLTARRINDVRTIDTSCEIFGRKWPSPIAIAPTSSQKAFHPEGELAVARTAKINNLLMMLSNVASTSIEDVNEARGEPVWFQLYAREHWDSSLKMIRRAEAAGCEVVVLTVDLKGSGKRETLNRFIKLDNRDCTACHGETRSAFRGRPMMDGIDLEAYLASATHFNTDLLDRIKDVTNMKLVVKGITHPQDAERCIEHGVDGIIVSNHGGRGQVSARGTIDVLPAIVDQVYGRIPILVDGGIRRGSDIYKALAFGADAVAIGRPYLWGLGSFGQPGVEKVINILSAELHAVMLQMGTASLEQITSDSVTRTL